MADDVIYGLIEKLTKNKAGQAVLNIFASGTMEGVEEVIVDVLDPFAQLIYNDQALKQAWTDPNRRSQMLYDYLIGFATGFGGGGVRTAAEAIGNKGSTAQTAEAQQGGQYISGRSPAPDSLEGLYGYSRQLQQAMWMYGDASSREIYEATGVELDGDGNILNMEELQSAPPAGPAAKTPGLSISEYLDSLRSYRQIERSYQAEPGPLSTGIQNAAEKPYSGEHPLQWPGEDAIVEGDGANSEPPPYADDPNVHNALDMYGTSSAEAIYNATGVVLDTDGNVICCLLYTSPSPRDTR